MPRALTHVVRPGEKVSLSKIDPDDTGPFDGKEDPRAAEQLRDDLDRLATLQERLYSEQARSVLIVLQAMDTAGKDGVLRKVVGPLDSRGLHVWSFKSPSEEERAHDYLWRAHAHTPRKGELAFFNRSHYEDVLVVRVLGLAPKPVWSRRYEHIVAFERMLHDEGTLVVKLFLHISKGEQRCRLQERLDDRTKNWKFDPKDLEMRAKWDDFIDAYEDALEKTSTDFAPWQIVPADKKWFRDLAVARALVEALEAIDPKIPAPTFDPKTIRID